MSKKKEKMVYKATIAKEDDICVARDFFDKYITHAEEMEHCQKEVSRVVPKRLGLTKFKIEFYKKRDCVDFCVFGAH